MKAFIIHWETIEGFSGETHGTGSWRSLWDKQFKHAGYRLIAVSTLRAKVAP